MITHLMKMMKNNTKRLCRVAEPFAYGKDYSTVTSPFSPMVIFMPSLT